MAPSIMAASLFPVVLLNIRHSGFAKSPCSVILICETDTTRFALGGVGGDERVNGERCKGYFMVFYKYFMKESKKLRTQAPRQSEG